MRLDRQPHQPYRLDNVGLSTRHGWRIKHPQAAKTKGKHSLYSRSPALAGGLYLFWGHGSGAKENAPTAPKSFGRRCFAATRSAFSHSDQRHTLMIYTFLIAHPGQTLADLKRVRTISCYAKSLSAARTTFPGLPLALISRTPVKRRTESHTPTAPHNEQHLPHSDFQKFELVDFKSKREFARPTKHLKRLADHSTRQTQRFTQTEENQSEGHQLNQGGTNA